MPRSFSFRVAQDESGLRLDTFLAARLGALSRMRIAVLAERGACSVEGVARPAGHKLEAGERVEVFDDEDKPTAMTPERLPLDIVHEDEQLVVVVKPAGMLVHPTHSDMTGTLANALAYHFNRARLSETEPAVRPGIVHRLDRATSGLMVVAKTQRALSVLSTHFQRRLVEKRYLALVSGVVAGDEMSVSAPIGRDPASRPEWNVRGDGKPSETRLRVLERAAGTTLVELEPVTGRTNQLRIHCAHAGHPIVGDEWYGAGARDEAGRLCLHASRLAFFHPSGGNRRMEFDSPAPFRQVR